MSLDPINPMNDKTSQAANAPSSTPFSRMMPKALLEKCLAA